MDATPDLNPPDSPSFRTPFVVHQNSTGRGAREADTLLTRFSMRYYDFTGREKGTSSISRPAVRRVEIAGAWCGFCPGVNSGRLGTKPESARVLGCHSLSDQPDAIDFDVKWSGPSRHANENASGWILGNVASVDRVDLREVFDRRAVYVALHRSYRHGV